MKLSAFFMFVLQLAASKATRVVDAFLPRCGVATFHRSEAMSSTRVHGTRVVTVNPPPRMVALMGSGSGACHCSVGPQLIWNH